MAAQWKLHEDLLLLEGVKKYGVKRWDKISASLLSSHRSVHECKKRFNSLIEPKTWTDDDDKRLIELAQIHKPQWTTIGCVMGRDGTSCHRRFLALEKNIQPESTKTFIPKRKVAQIENFPALRENSKQKKQKGCMKPKVKLD